MATEAAELLEFTSSVISVSLGKGDGLPPSGMLEGYAMVEKAELQHSANNVRALIEESGTGWDPYEVWLTRVRPQSAAR